MENVSWQKKYETGIEKIDGQHKHLIELINEVIDLANSKKENLKKEKDVFNSFMEYVRVHFTTEEKYFEESSFPGKEEHEREHAKVTELVLRYSMLIDEKKIKSSLLKLKEEFFGHINKYDMKYVKYFKKIGFKP